MSKITGLVKNHSIKKGLSKIGASILIASLAVCSCITSFAAEQSVTIPQSVTDAFQSGVTSIGDEITGYLGYVLPIALGIFGMYFVVRKGITFVRGLFGR